MIALTYLGGLLLSACGLLIIDYRFSLAFFYNAKRSALTLLCAVMVFVIWDVLGISLGIFLSGESKYATGIMLGPHFPLEELVFLCFFCYLTLILYRLGERR